VRVVTLGRRGWSNVSRNRHWLAQVRDTLPGLGLNGIVGFNKLPGLDVYFGSDPCYTAKVRRLKPAWYRRLPRYRHFQSHEAAVFARGLSTRILLLTDHEIPAYREAYGTEPERFHVLPPGVPRRNPSESERHQARAAIRRDHGWKESDRLLLFVGSGFRVKGLDRALHALASLPEEMRLQTRLAVIGGRDRPGRFASLARRAGVADRVHFLGGRDDVDRWMMGADLLVHPALSESAGMVLLEALTAGLPVLTTDTCGYAFHVRRAEAGAVLESPFDQDACGRRLREMLTTDPAPWRTGALAYAASQDLYGCHERAAEIVERVIGQK
jgi:UDP-glucose:(heptosyl)LPS alpha-1,3-glucosyltransferase